MGKHKNGTRTGFYPRTAKEEVVWHGFKLKTGMMFGEYKGEFLVFTGTTKTVTRRDGRPEICIKVYCLLRELEAIDPYWEVRWIASDSKTESVIVRKFRQRMMNNAVVGVYVTSDNKKSEHKGRALFASEKSGRTMNNPYTLNERVHGWR